MRSEFENWFKTTEAYKLIEEMNYFKIDLFTFKEHRSQYQHSAVQIAYMTYQHQQSKVDELQKRVDEQTRHIEMALLAVKDIHKSAIDEFHDWDVINEKAPKLCEHLQNLSVAVGELEQALKGGEDASN